MRALRRRLARLGIPMLDMTRDKYKALVGGRQLRFCARFHVSMRLRSIAPPAVLLAACACGGGSGPAAPSKIPTHTFTVVVFYDENGNGVQDASEVVRLPNAQVLVGGVSGKTDSTGRVTLTVPEGQQTVTVSGDSLP